MSLVVALLLLAAAGCRKAEGDNKAIRAALQKYLSERGTLNMAAMDFEVKQVTFEGDRAVAQVEFRAKQGGGTMEMTYNLQRQGNTWVVQAGRPSGGEMSHPPTGTDMPPAGTTELPPGHPPLTAPGKANTPPAKQN